MKPHPRGWRTHWIYSPSGRRIGFVNSVDEDEGRVVVKEMLERHEDIPWRKRGYLLRREGQRKPNQPNRRRKHGD